MKRTLFLGLALVPLFTGPSVAQSETPGPIVRWVTGTDLYHSCTTPTSEAFCIGYIEAVADFIGGGREIFGTSRACLPAGLNGYRLREVVTDYLETLPADSRDQTTAWMLAALALTLKYGCPKAP